MKLKYTILYLSILVNSILTSCTSTPTKNTNTDLRRDYCLSIGIKIPENDHLLIHPFPIETGYIYAIPQSWKHKIDFDKSTSENDSISIRYTCLNSVFINTASGNMDKIHASKNHDYKESGFITIINSDGTIEIQDTLNYIKGRGNSSWTKEKKSYNIKLAHKRAPLGLKKSAKFNLVSTRGITNELALQIAREFGASSAISSNLVNLYLNGEYRGLFLLTNKVEASNSSVNITNLDKKNKKKKPEAQNTIEKENGKYKYVSGLTSPEDITGGYIIEVMNFKYKYKSLPCGFISQEGNKIRFKAPEEATEEEVLYIQNLYNEMFSAAKALTGVCSKSGRMYSDYIDLESFAKYYLIEESLSNMDGGYGNLYIYKDRDKINPKLYAGPIWDMEWSMGINDYPYFKYPQAVNMLAGSTDENQKLFCYLFQHDDFRLIVDSLFQNCLYPILKQKFSQDTVPSELNNDAIINYLRWPDLYHSANEEYAQLCKYMRPHIDFLKEIFTPSAEEHFFTIKINAGYSKRNIMFYVRKGDFFTLPHFPWFSNDGQNKELVGWFENNNPVNDTIIKIDKNRYFELHWKE